MPWCCGLANSSSGVGGDVDGDVDGGGGGVGGTTTSTALITSDSDHNIQQQQQQLNASTQRKSFIIPDNFGPMLLQPKKMVSVRK